MPARGSPVRVYESSPSSGPEAPRSRLTPVPEGSPASPLPSFPPSLPGPAGPSAPPPPSRRRPGPPRREGEPAPPEPPPGTPGRRARPGCAGPLRQHVGRPGGGGAAVVPGAAQLRCPGRLQEPAEEDAPQKQVGAGASAGPRCGVRRPEPGGLPGLPCLGWCGQALLLRAASPGLPAAWQARPTPALSCPACVRTAVPDRAVPGPGGVV